MPSWHISDNLKEWIPILFHPQHFKVKEICEIIGVQKSLVYQTLTYHRDHGVPYNPAAGFAGQEQHQTLNLMDRKLIQSLLNQQHCLYPDKIQEELSQHHGVSVSVPTLLRTLDQLHFS
jgi:transposase